MKFGFCFVLFCLVLFFSIGFVSAVDFDGSGSGVLVDGGSVADFNESGHGSSFIGLEGIKYTYTKFGTFESIIKTAYGGTDRYEVLTEYFKTYFRDLFIHGIINNIYENNFLD